MTDLQWIKIKEIFFDALEKSPGEREIFLDQACHGDALTRAEVDSLLVSELASEDFIETPAITVSGVLEPKFANAGQRFGNYSIIRELGVGGMGAVFLAKRSDGEFDQLVAIKIVRQAIADNQLIERFRRERQILASLDHPNIARLLDGGVSEEGQPFFAMEYIDGESIIDYAVRRGLNLTDRLDLFLKVCSAVAYAHRNLIVHRDLKPSNILVDKEGQPKLLDFGLAKLVDENLLPDHLQTQTVFRALTPAYASPEQLRGEPLTTATDIYSLGVVFYELLTGCRPYLVEGKSLEQILHTVDEVVPPVPSSLSTVVGESLLKGDLDNIALMALRNEAERRYSNIDQFASDIERHINGLPVSARTNTFTYRTSKYFRRHKFGVLAAAIVLITLLSGIVASVWLARRAEMQRERAEKRFGQVRKISNSLLFAINDSVQNLQGSTPTRELIVSSALEYLDSLAQESGDDVGLQIELATAYQKVGDIQGNPYSANLGDTAGSLDSYKKSVAILENLNKSEITTESQISLGKSYRAVGDIMEVEGNVGECVKNYRRSLEIFEALSAQQADNLEIRDELARAYETLGDGLTRLENGAADELLNYQRNLAIREELVAEDPNNRKFRRSLGLGFVKVGGAFNAKQPEARENLSKGIVILEDLSNTDSTNGRARREVGFAYYQLGNILTEAELFPEALESRRKAFIIRKEIAANDPQNMQAQFDLGIAFADLSEAMTNTGDATQALVNARQSQDIMERLSQEDESNAIYRRNVGMSYEKTAFAYEHAAQNNQLTVAERRHDWDNSIAWYKKDEEIFSYLTNRNELEPRDVGQITKLRGKIAKCEASMAELKSKY